MNACGHHHVGHIGILGVDKNGEEWYQISLGGAQGNDAALGKVIGPSFAAAEVPDVIVAARRRLRREPARRRALHRHRAPHRPRAVQGARLCRSSLRTGAVVDDRWTLLRDAASLADVPDGDAGDRAARAVAGASATRCSRAATSASGSRRTTIRRRSPADVGTLPVIAVDFPQFTDGRGYSIARLLRERYGYRGRAARHRRRAARPALRARRMRLRRVRAARRTAMPTRRWPGFDDFAGVYAATSRTPQPWFRAARAASPRSRRRRTPRRSTQRVADARRRGCATSPRATRRRCSRRASAPRTWC